MTLSIEIELNNFWAKSSQAELAVRLHDVLKGSQGFGDWEPFDKGNGSWQIDRGNDWFFHVRSENILVVTGRYVQSNYMNALKIILEHAVGKHV